MPRYIVHRDGAYNVFTTVCDAFLFEPALTLHELKEWYQAENGVSGMRDLPARIERAHESGSSGRPPFDGLDWMINSTLQSDGQKHMPRDEVVRRFLTLPNVEASSHD